MNRKFWLKGEVSTAKELLSTISPGQMPLEFVPKSVIAPPQPVYKDSITLNLSRGVTLDLIKIPAGKLKMRGDHEITLKTFFLGKYPVTQKQYKVLMGEHLSAFKGDNLPIEKLSWHQAVRFCQKLSAKTGQQFMLPSETQWEYAARADSKTRYFFGNCEEELEDYSWYDKNSDRKTHPVGEKKPNPWGLYDMLGNVWQWCQDDWDDDYHNLPLNGHPYINKSNIKSLRGGSWNNSAFECACDYRNRNYGVDGYTNLGFRILMVL